MSIDDVIKHARTHAESHGLFDDAESLSDHFLGLIAEIGEAYQAWKLGKLAPVDKKWDFSDFAWFDRNVKDTLQDELADIAIYTCSIAAFLDIDLDKHIIYKLAYNDKRPYKHGKSRDKGLGGG